MDLAFKCNDIDYSQINRIELGKVNFSVSYLSLIASYKILYLVCPGPKADKPPKAYRHTTVNLISLRQWVT